MQPNSNYSNYPSNPSQFNPNSQQSSSLQPGTGQGFSISPNGFALGNYVKSQAQSQPDPQPNPSSYPSQNQQNSNSNYQQQNNSLPVPQSNNQQNNYSMEQSFSPQQHLQNLQNSQAYLQHTSNNSQQNAGNYQNNPQQNNANSYSNNPQMNNSSTQNSNNYQQNAAPQNSNNNYQNTSSANAQNLNNSSNNYQQNANNYSQNLSNSQAYPASSQNPQQGSNYYPPQNNSQNTSFTEPLSQQPVKIEPAKPKPVEQQEQKPTTALEEIPDFIPFVEPNSLKSQIPYPKDLAKIEGGPTLQGKYSFTPNTNAFYVIEEERNTAVLKTEAMKPHMIYKESLINEWVDEELPHDITCVTRDPYQQEVFRAVSWKKLSEVAPEDGFAIIYDTNRPQDLITGLLNDRALQSALAVLAENEDFFPYIFPEFNPSPAMVRVVSH